MWGNSYPGVCEDWKKKKILLPVVSCRFHIGPYMLLSRTATENVSHTSAKWIQSGSGMHVLTDIEEAYTKHLLLHLGAYLLLTIAETSGTAICNGVPRCLQNPSNSPLVST